MIHMLWSESYNIERYSGMLCFHLSDDGKQLEAYIAIMPFYEGIAIDNTCKSFKEAETSISHFRNECALLSEYYPCQQDSTCFAKQVDDLTVLFNELPLHGSDFEQYVEPLHCIQLRGTTVHPFTKSISPTFGVTRDGQSALVDALSPLLDEGVPLRELKQEIIDACYVEGDTVIPYDTFLMILAKKKTLCSDEAYEAILQSLDARKADIDAYTKEEIQVRQGINYYPITLLAGVFDEDYIQAEINPSIFMRIASQNRDQLSIAVQFFLAIVNIYLADVYGYSENMARRFDNDKALSTELAAHVKEAIISGGKVEWAIIDFLLEKGIVGQLNDEDKQAIIQRFTIQYNVTRSSKHLDEFFILPQKLPKGYRIQEGLLYIEFTHMADIHVEKNLEVMASFRDNLDAYKTAYPYCGATKPLILPLQSGRSVVVAFAEQREKEIQSYIETNPDEAIKYRDWRGCSLLVHAYKYRSYEIIRQLFTSSIDVSDDDLTKIIRYMLPHDTLGIRILGEYLQDSSNLLVTLLFEASKRNNPSQCKEVITALLPAFTTNTIILVRDALVIGSRYTMLVLLIEAGGIEIEQQDSLGRTILMHAVMKNDTLLVKQLIELGANVNHVDNEGNSLLYHALNMRAPDELVHALLDACPSLCIKGTQDLSELDLAILAGRNKAIIDRLIRAYDDLVREGYKYRPLLTAASSRDEETMRSLIEAMQGDARCSYHIVDVVCWLLKSQTWQYDDRIIQTLVSYVDLSIGLRHRVRIIYLLSSSQRHALDIQKVKRLASGSKLGNLSLYSPLVLLFIPMIANLLILLSTPYWAKILLMVFIMFVITLCSFTAAIQLADYDKSERKDDIRDLARRFAMLLMAVLIWCAACVLTRFLFPISPFRFAILIPASFIIGCGISCILAEYGAASQAGALPISSKNALCLTDFVVSPIAYLGSCVYYPLYFLSSILSGVLSVADDKGRPAVVTEFKPASAAISLGEATLPLDRAPTPPSL